jgi:phosphatidylethanolamine-binding protein (PEBP) family uncharacterized protein
VASIAVETTARLRRRDGIQARFTCKGADISPPVEWGGVESGAKELVVVVRTIAAEKLATNWLVAGIKPSQGLLRAGALPAGAIVGRNSFGTVGYRLCPPSGKPGLVIIGVYAFEKRLSLRPGFGQPALAEALESSSFTWGSTQIRVGGRSARSTAG